MTETDEQETDDAIHRHLERTLCSPAIVFEPDREEYEESGGE